MGLDMYAYAVEKGVVGDSEVDFKLSDDQYDQAQQFFYWRKHHDLHGWMEKLYRSKGGEADSFNCVNVEITAHDLDHLELDIKARKLPHTEGFFFGDFPPSEESDEQDMKFIKQARQLIADGKEVFYSSWW